MPLAVGVVNLGNDAPLTAVVVQTPEHTQRVEHMAEHTRVRKHEDATAGELQSVGCQKSLDVGTNRSSGVAEVIPGVELRQGPQSLRELGQIVDVESQL